ncbi:MAG: class C sortase [Lachnospiraceae bacterium]|nr:class C sortase [Lachnospiraceae bacterium]
MKENLDRIEKVEGSNRREEENKQDEKNKTEGTNQEEKSIQDGKDKTKGTNQEKESVQDGKDKMEGMNRGEEETTQNKKVKTEESNRRVREKKQKRKDNKEKKDMKTVGGRRGKRSVLGRIWDVLIAIVFCAGLAIMLYPVVADEWNTFLQERQISAYVTSVERAAEEEDFDEIWEAAREYNENLDSTSIYLIDVFNGEEESLEDTEYWNLLNVTGNGIMGYISIPKINVKIAIYHGTGEDVLKTGAGHLATSQLPIGGEGTHAVIAAHRGLPSARLFSDLDQLEAGDLFYIYILDETLAYEVDQILPMVDKDDTDTLYEALATVEGEDYVTLFTCTPYGVNSHRLLVRGHRVEYVEEETPTAAEAVLQAIQNYYMLFLLLGLAATALGILIVRAVVYRVGLAKK